MCVYINPTLTVITTLNSTVNLKNVISEFHHLLWVNLDLFLSEVKFLKGPKVPSGIYALSEVV